MSRNSIRWIFNCRGWSPAKEDLLIGLSCIQEEERNRIFDFYFKKDSKHSLIGQLMLRRCISDCLNIQYDQVQFKRTDKGKPVLTDQLQVKIDQPFDFNISHDGDYCVLAADECDKVGVDISRVKESNKRSTCEYFKTMDRIFSPQEWTFIKDCDPRSINQGPLDLFHRLWALKESFVKAEAIGIGFELRRIRFDCPTKCLSINKITTDTLIYLDGKLQKDWLFEESLIDSNHVVSVALSGHNLAPLKARSANNLFNVIQFNKLINPDTRINVSEHFWDKFNSKDEGRYE